MTEPDADDVFLDPFCGYGGIALERALAAPYRFVFASDDEPEKIAAVKTALYGPGFEKRRRTIFPKVRDVLDSNAFDEGFVTAIATDPPWDSTRAVPAKLPRGSCSAASSPRRPAYSHRAGGSWSSRRAEPASIPGASSRSPASPNASGTTSSYRGRRRAPSASSGATGRREVV